MSTATNQPQILIITCIVITVGIVGIGGVTVVIIIVTVGGPRDGEL